MIERHFIVSERDRQVWVYSFRGDETGPFKTRQKAIDAAIADAVQDGDPHTKVIVIDHDQQQETLWTNPDR